MKAPRTCEGLSLSRSTGSELRRTAAGDMLGAGARASSKVDLLRRTMADAGRRDDVDRRMARSRRRRRSRDPARFGGITPAGSGVGQICASANQCSVYPLRDGRLHRLAEIRVSVLGDEQLNELPRRLLLGLRVDLSQQLERRGNTSAGAADRLDILPPSAQRFSGKVEFRDKPRIGRVSRRR